MVAALGFGTETTTVQECQLGTLLAREKSGIVVHVYTYSLPIAHRMSFWVPEFRSFGTVDVSRFRRDE